MRPKLTTDTACLEGTLTGGSIQTAASGPRVRMDASGLTVSDGSTANYGLGAGVRFHADAATGAVGIGNGLMNLYDAHGVLRLALNPNALGGDVAAAYDPNGNMIWDALGLVGVVTPIGVNIDVTSYGTTGTTNTIGTQTVTIPGTRPQTVLGLMGIYCDPLGTTGASVINAVVKLNGVSSTFGGVAPAGGDWQGYYWSTFMCYWTNVPIGTATVSLYGGMNNATPLCNVGTQGILLCLGA